LTAPPAASNPAPVGRADAAHDLHTTPAADTRTRPIEIDAVVIGAGPVGLFQVFELGLVGIRCHVIDALPVPGGQCIQLYPDKPIYDIPATKVCTGRELVERLMSQAEPFTPAWHLGQQVDAVETQADGRLLVGTSRGTWLLTKVLIVAGGVGSFQPRRLKIEGLAAFENSQVFYSLPGPAEDSEATENSEASQAIGAIEGRRVVVIGDDDDALGCATRLAMADTGRPTSVTLMHRRDEFKAAPKVVTALRRLRDEGRLAFLAAQVTGLQQAGGRLTGLQVLNADGDTRTLPVDTLLVLTGLSPKLGPIADWGLALERRQISVDTATFQTNVPGIFAVGDINTYPGKKKLIVSGFHEATLAAFGAAAVVFPDQPVRLEYTTTSPRLHRALGVAAAGEP